MWEQCEWQSCVDVKCVDVEMCWCQMRRCEMPASLGVSLLNFDEASAQWLSKPLVICFEWSPPTITNWFVIWHRFWNSDTSYRSIKKTSPGRTCQTRWWSILMKTSRHLQCRSSFKTFTSHSAASSMDTWRSSTARSWGPDRQKNEAVIPIINMFNMWVHRYPQQPTISQPSFCSFYLTIRLD